MTSTATPMEEQGEGVADRPLQVPLCTPVLSRLLHSSCVR